jgi:hypothetical protein
MRALFSDSACERSNCEDDHGQDQQQPQQLARGDASGNRRHDEDHSENDQNESQRAIFPPRILAACRPNDKGLRWLAGASCKRVQGYRCFCSYTPDPERNSAPGASVRECQVKVSAVRLATVAIPA